MWIQLTTQDVLDEFSLAEQTSLIGLGAVGTLDKILAKTVGTVRGSIKAGSTPLGAAGTIPEQLAQDVVAIARWRWLSSAPLLQKFKSEDRKKLYDDARNTLKDVSNGRLKVELPDQTFVANADPSPSDQVETVSALPRTTLDRCHRQPLHGLI